jgi:mediator of RNA polymerase II transcription subunit 18
MHELLLSGQVLLSRHEQVLKIFAGVTGMQPRRVFKRHILYKPLREPEEPGLHRKRGGTQDVAVKNTKQTANKDLYVTQLVQQLDEDDFSNGGGPRDAKEDSLKAGDGTRWTWLFNDVPEAGDRDGVNVRMTHTTDILHGDVHAYMVDSGNQYAPRHPQRATCTD